MLPAISLGLWQNFGGLDAFETGRAILRRAFDRGVTHFDLANNYGPPPGAAEENFGRVLAADSAKLSGRDHGFDQSRIPTFGPAPTENGDRARACSRASRPV